jgi:hypothetical protein
MYFDWVSLINVELSSFRVSSVVIGIIERKTDIYHTTLTSQMFHVIYK